MTDLDKFMAKVKKEAQDFAKKKERSERKKRKELKTPETLGESRKRRSAAMKRRLMYDKIHEENERVVQGSLRRAYIRAYVTETTCKTCRTKSSFVTSGEVWSRGEFNGEVRFRKTGDILTGGMWDFNADLPVMITKSSKSSFCESCLSKRKPGMIEKPSEAKV